MVTVELFSTDLNEKGIEKLKEAGVWNENWEVFPITILEFEEEEQEDE